MAKFTSAQVERERPWEPFEAEMDSGNVYPLPHPKELPAAQLVMFDPNNPGMAMQALLGENFAGFLAEPEVDGFYLESLMGAYVEHYGLGSPGNAAASPRSSNGTARPSKQTSRSAARR